MAYPIAQATDWERTFGAKRGEKICIDISFENLEIAKMEFKNIENGIKDILDYKQNILNQRDLEFI